MQINSHQKYFSGNKIMYHPEIIEWLRIIANLQSGQTISVKHKCIQDKNSWSTTFYRTWGGESRKDSIDKSIEIIESAFNVIQADFSYNLFNLIKDALRGFKTMLVTYNGDDDHCNMINNAMINFDKFLEEIQIENIDKITQHESGVIAPEHIGDGMLEEEFLKLDKKIENSHSFRSSEGKSETFCGNQSGELHLDKNDKNTNTGSSYENSGRAGIHDSSSNITQSCDGNIVSPDLTFEDNHESNHESNKNNLELNENKHESNEDNHESNHELNEDNLDSNENTHESNENTLDSNENTHESNENTLDSNENTHESNENTHESNENTLDSNENTHESNENTHESNENNLENNLELNENTHESNENTHESNEDNLENNLELNENIHESNENNLELNEDNLENNNESNNNHESEVLKSSSESEVHGSFRGLGSSGEAWPQNESSSNTSFPKYGEPQFSEASYVVLTDEHPEGRSIEFGNLTDLKSFSGKKKYKSRKNKKRN